MKLPHTTRQRLQLYKTRAKASKYNNDWRGHRYGKTWPDNSTGWTEDRREIYATERDSLGDYLGDWHTLYPWRPYRDCLGFYADNNEWETIRGGVERMRTARGTYYIPTTYSDQSDCALYYMADAEIVPRGSREEDHENARNEAARIAYDRAEREGERSRDDNAKQQAELDIETEREEIHAINKQARALLAEIRGQEFTDNICAALRHRLHEYLEARRQCFRVIKERQENYWSAVPY